VTRTELVFTVLAEAVRFLLGLAITGINAAVLWIVLNKTMPEVNKDLIIAIVNGTGILQGTVLQYYFGSSAGSAAKDRKQP
jgi:hypothetical protein